MYAIKMANENTIYSKNEIHIIKLHDGQYLITNLGDTDSNPHFGQPHLQSGVHGRFTLPQEQELQFPLH